jgi:hypothetical protein
MRHQRAVELPPPEPHSATFSVLINSPRYSIPKWKAQMRSNIVTLAASTIATAASTSSTIARRLAKVEERPGQHGSSGGWSGDLASCHHQT